MAGLTGCEGIGMIPAEAVEAAVGALHESWCEHATREQWATILTDALEAAAPHMLAEAWEEGKEAGMLDYYHAPNPYRSQP